MRGKKKVIFKTWDQMCLDKLSELGRSGLSKWAKAMGYANAGNMAKTARILIEEGLVRDFPNPGGHVRRYYEAVEGLK